VRRITKSTRWCTQIIDGKCKDAVDVNDLTTLIRAHVLLSLLNMPWDGAGISVHLVSTCRECDRMKSLYLLFDPLRPREASWVHGTRSRAMYRFVEESETRQTLLSHCETRTSSSRSHVVRRVSNASSAVSRWIQEGCLKTDKRPHFIPKSVDSLERTRRYQRLPHVETMLMPARHSQNLRTRDSNLIRSSGCISIFRIRQPCWCPVRYSMCSTNLGTYGGRQAGLQWSGTR
jgi:hypothetical protein